MKIATLLLLGIFSIASSFNLEDPQQEGVEYVDNTSEIQVTVDEYNPGGKTTIVRITDTDEVPQIVPLSSNADRLEAEIQQDSESYILQINLFDYESLVKQSMGTVFNVGVVISEIQTNIRINIKNIDDENPVLEPPAAQCYMEEEIVIDVTNSDCTFKVSDPDGWLSQMTFEVSTDLLDPQSGISVENRIFELKYKTPPDDNVYESDVYLVLSDGVTLDYESRVDYQLSIEAKDSAGNPTTPAVIEGHVVTVDRAPFWAYLPSEKHIDEETETTLQIFAVDADQHGFKKTSYAFLTYSEYFSIDNDTGIIIIEKIDRELGITNISMTVVAFYATEANSVTTEGVINFIVDDIDDHVPQIDRSITDITITRNSIKVVSIVIEDLDEGDNAIYDIDIVALPETSPAVDVTPKIASGRTSAEITIDSGVLERNQPHLHDFYITLWTTGVKTGNFDYSSITIHLINSSSRIDVGVNWVITTIVASTMVLYRI